MAATRDLPSAAASYPDLAGKIAVVTGGSRGIGAATALALARNGALVAVVGRDTAAVRASSDAVRASAGSVRASSDAVTGAASTAIGVVADCTSEADLAALREEVTARLGAADIVAAFAGGDGMPVPTASETGAHWREVVDNELTSVFLTVSAFLPAMIERQSGVIITMSSAAARQPARSCAAYAAAKAGVIAFTRHLANEAARDGVRVNCIAPSAVENDKMRARMTGEQRAELGALFPLGRIGQADDIAAAALFLASASASWITGVTLDVAGGKIMV